MGRKGPPINLAWRPRWLNPALNPSLAYSLLGGIGVQLAVSFIQVSVVYSPLGRIEVHWRLCNLVYPGHPGLTRGHPVYIQVHWLAGHQALGCAWRSRRLANCRLPVYIAWVETIFAGGDILY